MKKCPTPKSLFYTQTLFKRLIIDTRFNANIRKLTPYSIAKHKYRSAMRTCVAYESIFIVTYNWNPEDFPVC